MTTGIKYLAIERQKQIDKYGFTGEHHATHPEWYDNGQLVEAARILSMPNLIIEVNAGCPENWDKKWFDNLCQRNYKERLIIAGALIAAEIDRQETINKNNEKGTGY